MDNPWIHLPTQPPFILERDLSIISEFNKSTSNEHKIVTDILPEPFLGNLQKAKVVLLNLNPGYDPRDHIWHKNAEFETENRKDLLHQSNPPFYLLNTRFKGSAGFDWWFDHLRQFIWLFGIEKVADDFMCIEYFPYHSKKYKRVPSLTSQNYSFFLVNEAIKQKKVIIMMRGKRIWLEAVPELNKYPYQVLNSPQNVRVTKNNLPDGQFDKIIDILK